MDFEEFKKNLTEGLAKLYGDAAEVETGTVLKNNGCHYNGIKIYFNDETKSTKTAPVIEIDSLYGIYESGNMNMSECVTAVYHERERLKDYAEAEMLAKNLSEWECVKNNVYPMLLSTEENQELLKKLVYTPILDLSVVYIIRKKLLDDSTVSIKISWELLKHYGVSSEQLNIQAMKNLENDGYEFKSMDTFIRMIGLMGKLGAELGDRYNQLKEIYVLTNTSKSYGAAGILNSKMLKEFAGKRNFFILPSSQHETIFIPASDEADKEFFDHMVSEVNRIQVSVEERLTDHSYYYDSAIGEIRMCA